MDTEVEMSSIPLTIEEDTCSTYTKTKHPVLLKFEDVFYKISTQEKAFCSLKRSKMGSEKVILRGMTGLVLPGEMLAMLGPSGSGKTTLLTALGGRLCGDLSGSITYNGKPFNNAMKRNTGFVTQDDVLYAHLTVYETLVFTALLRLPKCLSRSEKEEHAKKVMDQLGLTKCKDIMIGGPLLRGVSGGERKRVSIGQEMLINPSLLFLDEPTSGLDSTTAQSVVSTLSELAGGGTTVVMTIHQPSSKLYYMFHKILLLSDGRSLYFGKGSEALDYFSGIGHAPTVAMNPSDVLLDLANGILPWNNVETDEKAVKQALADAYEEKVVGKLKAELASYRAEWCMEESSDQMGEWSCNWWEQFTILLARGVKERRHEAFSGLKVGQVIAVAIIAGLLWWRSDVAHLQDQVGLLFFYSTFWSMFPLFESIFTFPDEQAMLIKERASGMYRLSSYFMARTVVDMPMEMALPTLFLTISYLMAGLRPTLANFLATLSAVLLAVLVSQGLGLALGALFMNLKMASTLGSVFMLTSLLAGGYYVQHVPFFIAWIKYISLTHHTYKLLLLSQYSPQQTYPCPTTISCKVADFPTIKLVGLDYDDHPVFSMFLMLLGYRLIAYTSLMRVGVTR